MSKKKKQVFNEDFLKIKSNIPSLKKGESAASFKKRVAMWTSRTGLEFPDSAKGLTGLRIRMTPEGRALSGESLGETDYSKGYTNELNKLVQSNIRRFDANQKAEKKLGEVPESGMSDLRGQEGVEADAEQARQDKILFGEDLMEKYFDPNNPDNDFDAGPGQTDLQIARAGSIDPDTATEASLAESLKIMQGTDSASRLAQNSTMADQLRETNARMSRIERENRLRLGDERVDFLKQKQVDFKSMDRKAFAKKYPKSQTAKRLKLRLGA
tara:strand:+ start:57 stop:866 length:810 start_codon:yes stop_codon:yes gene_type:complete